MRSKRPAMRFKRPGLLSTLALSYSCFLLLCLFLGAALYVSSSRAARVSFWERQAVDFERAVSAMDEDLSAMDHYTRQLLIDSTFIRFSGMKGMEEKGFMYTAYEVMQSLASRLFSLSALPVNDSRIYLPNCGYVISGSQFTEVEQFYNNWRSYTPGLYGEWLNRITGVDGAGECVNMSRFSGNAGDYVFARDVNAIMNRNVPAIIWFELDRVKIRQRFLQEGVQAAVTINGADGRRQMLLASDPQSAALAEKMDALPTDARGYAALDDFVVIRRRGSFHGWEYTIALPRRLCDEALGNYDLVFWLMMGLSVLFGGALIVWMVQRSMRPVRQLSTKLTQAQGDNERLQREMDTQRPLLQTSYLRKLLSGHVSSSEEFGYILRFLGLRDGQRFYVLYVVAYRQDGAPGDPARVHDLLADAIARHLENGQPVLYYVTLSDEFIVLSAYDASETDPLMDLQRRVLALHNELLENESLWVYAGVGKGCDQAQSLWESYEQARRAARYTPKGHIFLPYEFIRKDADTLYYPVEISAKLQHFITTGNAQQVTEMFALLRRENLEERSLPIFLLNFLLSDLRNTLLKARFQAPESDANRERLALVDERLSGTVSFPVLEGCAATLCECFTRTVDPADPIADVRKYLAENYADPSMCLTKLSDQFHISESYLSHLFKDKTGQNVSVYLETLRLTAAAERLRDPACNLSALYAELGYNNPTTFRRAFKKRYGMTPSEMRSKEAP